MSIFLLSSTPVRRLRITSLIVPLTNRCPGHVYSRMESLCISGGGWTRVAYLNLSDPTDECPSGFRLYDWNDIRACGRAATSSCGYCQ